MIDADLAELLSEVAARHGLIGAVVRLERPGGRLAAAAGVADLGRAAPCTRDTVFPVGSIAKLMTAILVMVLRDEGRLDLDSPIRRVLPALPARIGEGITARRLLNHTSGLDGDVFTDTGDGIDALERYVATLAEVEPLAAPGTLHSYCNAGFAILGRLAEIAGGDDWATLLTRKVLVPLGMSRSAALPDGLATDDFAVGHMPGPAGESQATRPGFIRALGPAGATPVAAAADLVRLGRVLVDGAGLLAPATVAEMRQSWTDDPAWAFVGARGLGTMLFDWSGGAVYGHDGAFDGILNYLRVRPEDGTVATLLTTGGDGRTAAHEMFGALFTDGGPKPPSVGQDAPLSDTDDYTGVYASQAQTVVVTAEANRLVALMRPNVTDRGALTEMRVRLDPVGDGVGAGLFSAILPGTTTPTPHRFVGRNPAGRFSHFVFRGRALRRR